MPSAPAGKQRDGVGVGGEVRYRRVHYRRQGWLASDACAVYAQCGTAAAATGAGACRDRCWAPTDPDGKPAGLHIALVEGQEDKGAALDRVKHEGDLRCRRWLRRHLAGTS